jgi:hypothetical protein
MANDAATTVAARRRQRVDRTFEAVERMRGPAHDHLEGFVYVGADLMLGDFDWGHPAPGAWVTWDPDDPQRRRRWDADVARSVCAYTA